MVIKRLDRNKYIFIKVTLKKFSFKNKAIKFEDLGGGVGYFYKDEEKLMYQFSRENFNRFKAISYLMTSKSITEEMRLAVSNVDNTSYLDHVKWCKEQKLNIVKNQDKQIELDKGFKIVSDSLEAILIKSTDAEDRWVIKSSFVCNKSDIVNDITSSNAIKGGIDKFMTSLKDGKRIPLRKDHREDNYGVITSMWYVDTQDTIDGKDVAVTYGFLEAELDKSLNRSQDLWRDITIYNKKFGMSYGAVVTDFTFEKDSETGTILRIIKDLEFKEVSITPKPAIVEAGVVSAKKYASKIIKNLNMNETEKELTPNMTSEERLNETISTNLENIKPVTQAEIEQIEEILETVAPEIIEEVEAAVIEEPKKEIEPVKEETLSVEQDVSMSSNDDKKPKKKVKKSLRKVDVEKLLTKNNAPVMDALKGISEMLVNLEKRIKAVEETPQAQVTKNSNIQSVNDLIDNVFKKY